MYLFVTILKHVPFNRPEQQNATVWPMGQK